MIYIFNNIRKEKNSFSTSNFTAIYQYADGSYLPNSSQPDIEKNYKINAQEYTPHKSTRYINIKLGNNGKAKKINNFGEYIECEKDLPELYYVRENCCGCTACYTICPIKAIKMRPDEEGFVYPVIDAAKCLRCYKCINVCPIRKYL
ncbi:MAG: 4Fe-4S dicluster domain-containing protein [Erysipelotrichaceae bacterium]|nr:4Fe-4S dicluster domain-containing protein [Erysipelotrichaceae bacterium]